MADLLQKAHLNDLRHHSNFDRSFRNLLSCDPGPLYPVLVEEVFPGDFFRIDEQVEITTSPLKAPLKGGFMQEVAYFFVPLRLYQQLFDTNRLTFDASAPLPTCYPPGFILPERFSDSVRQEGYDAAYAPVFADYLANPSVSAGNASIAPCSLVDLLDIAGARTLPVYHANLSAGVPLNGAPVEFINEIAALGYVDIIRNYFSDPNVPFIPMIGTSLRARSLYGFSYYYDDFTSYNELGVPYYNSVPLSFLDDLIQNVVSMSARGMSDDVPYFVTINAGTSDVRYVNNKTQQQNALNFTDTDGTVYVGAVPAGGLFSKAYTSYGISRFSAAAVWDNLAMDQEYMSVGPCPWGVYDPDTIMFGLGDFVNGLSSTSSGTQPYVNAIQPDFMMPTWHVPAGGLFLRTLRPDLFSAFFDKTNYKDLEESVTINGDTDGSGNTQLTYNQIRVGSHLQAFNDRLFMSDGRYGGFIETEWCVQCDTHLCIPEILGVHRSSINFRTVVSQSNQSAPELGSDVSGLGDLGGLGYGRMSGKPITFSAKEHGIIMAIYSICPIVSYGNRFDPYHLNLSLDDIYSPAMDNVGFQPLPIRWMNDAGRLVRVGNEYQFDIDSPFAVPWYTLGNIGYQPAWNQLTSRVDQTHGEFSPGGELSFWAINRRFDLPNDIYYFFDVVFPTVYAPFVYPWLYEYPFTLQSYDVDIDQASFVPGIASNFHADFEFFINVKRKKSKNIQPTLA